MKTGRFFLLIILILLISQITFAQNADTLKSEIYSKLRDRRCTTMSLDKCNCPDAREMKAYIDALLEAGVSKEEIFYKVAKKFSPNTILDKQIKAQVEARLIKEAGGKRPQIVLEPDSFDLGQVSKKQGKVSRNFKLSNKGNSPLIIKNIKTSCPCASVSLEVDKNKSPYFGTEGSPKDWQGEIKSGQTGELEMMIDFASPHINTGKLIRDATIISNDPLYPEVTVRVEAEVIE